MCLAARQKEEQIRDDLQEAGRRHSKPLSSRGGQQGHVVGLSGQLGQEDTIIVNESDCFNMDDNEWLTLEEREAMKEEERVAAGEAHVKAGQKDYL